MKLKNYISVVIVVAIIATVISGFGIQSFAIGTDTTSIEIGDTLEVIDTVEDATISSDPVEGNVWHFETSDASKLKIVNTSIDGKQITFLLKGVSLGTGIKITCKQYNANTSEWEDASLFNGLYDVVPATLDIENNEKSIDLNYTITENVGLNTGATKVKLTWNITDIEVNRTKSQIWDTEELKWVDNDSETITPGSATFAFENYSSIEIDAKASFVAEEGFSPVVTFDETTGEDGTIVLDTANGNSKYSKTNIPKGEIQVTVTPGDEDFLEKSATTSSKYGTYTVEISQHTNCLAIGTKITMADGSLKNIEDIEEGEEVLTFNHEIGALEAQKVYLAYVGDFAKRAFTLHFDNGSTLSIVGLHDLFEQESMQYVPVTENNATDFVGKHFYNTELGQFVKLTEVTYETKETSFYSLYTEYNGNCIANGMLTLPDDIDEFFNIFEFNNDLTINQEELEKDIAEFGIYEYPVDAFYSKEIYDIQNIKYINILVGKGFGTMDEFRARLADYLTNY